MKKKKNVMYRKSVSILAAAAMTAMLMSGQVYPVLAENGNVESNLETSSLIPDNVTIDQPVALSQIALPKSDYGTLSWADGTFIPDNRVQACDVVFKPAENVDLSYLPGWDAQMKVVKGTINVVVSSLEETASSDAETPADDNKEEQAPEEITPTEVPTEVPSETPAAEAEESTVDTVDKAENSDEAKKPADDILKDASVTEVPSEAETILTDEKEMENALDTPASSAEEKEEDTSAKATEAAADDADDSNVQAGNPEPTVSEAPAQDTGENESAGGMLNEKFGDLMPGATVLDEVEVESDTVEEPEEDTSSEEANIFDNPTDFTVSDDRPDTAEEGLTEEEQAARAAENHTCEGITVSGIDLPWYVQFQVESGENYEFKNEDKANIFQSYEFKLWDLKNNTEYEIPDGQYISVTIPVKEGYEYSIEHLLENGATETIIPSVNGNTMVFSTHSFSPFGIAGFRPIIGDEIANGAYGVNGTPTPTPTVTISQTPTPSATGSVGTGTNGTDSTDKTTGTAGTTGTGTDSSDGSSASGTTGTADNSGNTNTSGSAGDTSDADSTTGTTENSSTGSDGTSSTSGSSSNSESSQSSGSTAGNNGQNQTSKAVKTGDNTMVLPFVFLVIAAGAVIAAVLGIRRKENE